MSRWQNRLAGIKCFVLLGVLCSPAPSPVPVTHLVMLVKVVAMQLAQLFGMTMSSQRRKWDLVRITLVSGSKLGYSAKKTHQHEPSGLQMVRLVASKGSLQVLNLLSFSPFCFLHLPAFSPNTPIRSLSMAY